MDGAVGAPLDQRFAADLRLAIGQLQAPLDRAVGRARGRGRGVAIGQRLLQRTHAGIVAGGIALDDDAFMQRGIGEQVAALFRRYRQAVDIALARRRGRALL